LIEINLLLLSQQTPIDSKFLPMSRPTKLEMVSHISFATTQSKNRCWQDSFSSQNKHVIFSTFCLLAKLSLVRTLFLVNNQRKNWTLEEFSVPRY
jgi:hypothetical protein